MLLNNAINRLSRFVENAVGTCSDPPYLTSAPILQTLGLQKVGGSQPLLLRRMALGPSLVSSQWSVMTEVSVQRVSSLPQGPTNFEYNSYCNQVSS